MFFGSFYGVFLYICTYIGSILNNLLLIYKNMQKSLRLLSSMRSILCVLWICFLPGCVLGQVTNNEGDINSLLGYMKHAMLFNRQTPQEKVYLHLDNAGYFNGEKIWFSAYVIRCDVGKPTDISKVLYVELVNPSGDVIKTNKLYIDNGKAHGDITLDSIYGSGFYEVRAYTRYMTNWGNTGIYSRVIPVFNKPNTEGDYSKKVIDDVGYRRRLPSYRSDDDGQNLDTEGLKESTKTQKNYKVSFYPEGGYLVKGLTCRLAYMITDEDGAAENIGGELIDRNKNLISVFTTVKDGRGMIEVVPNGEPMYFRLETEKGKTVEFELPKAIDSGCSLSLDVLKDDVVSASLFSTSDLLGKLMGYVLMNNGKVLSCDTMKLEESQVLSFERKGLPAGVNQLVFFDSNGLVYADRLFFICPTPSVNDSVFISSPTTRINPCGKIVLNITSQPNSSISLSAIDASTMTNGMEGNAMSWLLLSSEVKGYISHPEYYFEADDKEHRLNADLLMMVQGWRRYNWGLMSGTAHFKKIEPIEDKLYLFGSVVSTKKKNTVDNVDLNAFLYNSSGQSLKGDARTDSLGNYAFALPDVSGEWTLMIKTLKEGKAVNYRVKIDRHFSPVRRTLSASESVMIPSLAPNLFNLKNDSITTGDFSAVAKRSHILPEVKVKGKRRIFEGARQAWETERSGQHWASIYYNVDDEADKIADEGLTTPGFYEWLASRNPFFGGTENQVSFGTEENIETDDGFTTKLTNEQDANIQEPADMNAVQGAEAKEGVSIEASESISYRMFVDGMGYKNRPIVWILNNNYAQITNVGYFKPSTVNIFRQSKEDMPIFIDEIKSVYISERSDAYRTYLHCPDLMGKNPVTIFVYTHHVFLNKEKGLRRSHFYGYDMPSTFEMEDYSLFPPMEDFRRTIFWAPDIKTDENGKASISFYNNSSCREMYISAEGMTPEGKFIVND